MRRTIALAEATRTTAVPAGALAAGLAVLAWVLGWRGADAPNYLFRIDLYRRAGFTVWNTAWYGGHYTLGYSALLPPLGTVLGPAVLGITAAATAAICFARVLDGAPGVSVGRRRAATLLFAAGTVTNLAVGRLAFALGLALGLAAVLAGRSGHWRVAGVLSVGTTLASPVAGCFLALAWTASALVRGDRRTSIAALACGASAIVPLAVTAELFPEGGSFPFRWSALAAQLAVCALALVVVPTRYRAVRIGVVLYGTLGVLAFAVPSPLGGNVVRLGMYLAAPVLVAVTPRARSLIVVLALPSLLFWQWAPAFDGMFRAGADPSTAPAYYEPLIAFLDRQGVVGRIEIPFTQRHFETAYVAAVVPLARGWERQLDIRSNPLFYAPTFDAIAYHRWLLANGVQFVALPDASLDPSARVEAMLVSSGLPFLEPIWQSAHWRVWQVVGSPGIVSGPADLVAQGPKGLVLDARHAGTVLVRVRWTDTWSVSGPACAEPSPDGWTRVRASASGRIVLAAELVGDHDHCPV